MLIDCHCHLSFPQFKDNLSGILEEVKNSLYGLIESTINLQNATQTLRLLGDKKFVFFSLGFHPYHAREFTENIIKECAHIIENNERIVAIGEIGLDVKSATPLDIQAKVFSEFLDLAKQFNLPLVIHNRGFKEKILTLVKEKKVKKVVFHCFSQDKEFAKDIINQGYFISFAGNITFKNAHLLREAAKETPLDYILSETDAPYLAPQIIRGRRNNPLYVDEVVKEISLIKNKVKEEIENSILNNAKSIFGI